MVSLLNMSEKQIVFFTSLIVVVTVCVVVLIKVLGTFFSKLHLQKLETKAGSVTFNSPHDRISFHTMEINEPTHVDLNSAMDWIKHPYFTLLITMKAKGVRVKTKSPIKAQFINEYVKIYATTMISELQEWIKVVIDSKGKELGNIILVMNTIEIKCQSVLQASIVEIEYEGEKHYMRMPNLLIDKMFNSYSISQSVSFETLDKVLDSVFYEDWQDQLKTILMQLYTITSVNFIGMENAIKTLNGELDEYFQEMIKTFSKKLI